SGPAARWPARSAGAPWLLSGLATRAGNHSLRPSPSASPLSRFCSSLAFIGSSVPVQTWLAAPSARWPARLAGAPSLVSGVATRAGNRSLQPSPSASPLSRCSSLLAFIGSSVLFIPGSRPLRRAGLHDWQGLRRWYLAWPTALVTTLCGLVRLPRLSLSLLL